MHKDGYETIYNIDIAHSATEKMIAKYSKKYPKLICISYVIIVQTMDATRMTFKEEFFDYAIDKATFDALIVFILLSNRVNVGMILHKASVKKFIGY